MTGLLTGRASTVVLAALTGFAFLAGLWLTGGALYIEAKAHLSQVLLSRAWAARDDVVGAPPPWPWADIRPAYRLTVPLLNKTMVVMETASAEALAFGPGRVALPPEFAAERTLMFAGHRDSHFAFLEHAGAVGTFLVVEDTRGRNRFFRVEEAGVFDLNNVRVYADPDQPELLLVTCYPFGAPRAATSWRYVIRAVEVAKG